MSDYYRKYKKYKRKYRMSVGGTAELTVVEPTGIKNLRKHLIEGLILEVQRALGDSTTHQGQIDTRLVLEGDHWIVKTPGVGEGRGVKKKLQLPDKHGRTYNISDTKRVEFPENMRAMDYLTRLEAIDKWFVTLLGKSELNIVKIEQSSLVQKLATQLGKIARSVGSLRTPTEESVMIKCDEPGCVGFLPGTNKDTHNASHAREARAREARDA
jgi:hypothetical protein